MARPVEREGVEPVRRSPENLDGLGHAIGSSGGFAPPGAGQGEVGQHQVGMLVAVEIAHGDVGGVGGGPGAGLSPAGSGFSTHEVDFALIRPH